MKRKKLISIFMTATLIFALITAMTVTAFASGEDASTDISEAPAENATGTASGESKVTIAKAIAAAIAVGIVGAAGAIAMGVAISKSSESMARQPEAAPKINSAMMLGLVFIETVIIYALIVAILIIFVL